MVLGSYISGLLRLFSVKVKSGSEDCVHIDCMNYLKSIYNNNNSIRWYHIPSQMYIGNDSRKFVYLNKIKAMGWYSGIWDLVVWVQGSPIKMYIEFKTEKGSLTDNQILFKEWVGDQFTEFRVVRSVLDFKKVLTEVLNVRV